MPVATGEPPAAAPTVVATVPTLRAQDGAASAEALRSATMPAATTEPMPGQVETPAETAASPGTAPTLRSVPDPPAASATSIEVRSVDGGEAEAASRSPLPDRTTATGPEAVAVRPARPDSSGSRGLAVQEAARPTEGAPDTSLDGVDPITTRVERPAEHASATARPSTPGPAAQVAMQIAKAVPSGVTRMLVQLEPAQLGRVEVRLELGHDNRIAALITADRPDTLDALQRDVRSLERSLEQAGLSLDDAGLSFGLAERGSGGEHRAHQHGSESASSGLPRSSSDGEPPPSRAPWIGVGLIDIRV